jgi:3'-phosphoadenosine 5'-phosphosulfate sulfotransferase (PAPS reductase)/FAD synthetase
MQDKIESAKTILRDANSTGIPALMCSFGKDSMVLLHLIREAFPRTGGPNDRAYPMPVICWKQPGFPQKQRFAN